MQCLYYFKLYHVTFIFQSGDFSQQRPPKCIQCLMRSLGVVQNKVFRQASKRISSRVCLWEKLVRLARVLGVMYFDSRYCVMSRDRC